MDRKQKKRLILGVISVIAVLLILPIIINGLMFIRIIPIKGDENTWISSLSTFWGAIIGGIISGLLTLVGVSLTIKASFKGIKDTIEFQSKEGYKDRVGSKLKHLYTVKSIIYRTDRLLSNRKYGWDEKFEKVDISIINNSILEYLLPNLNNLLELSASVDWEFYEDIKSFVENARKDIYSNSKDIDFDSLTEEVDRIAIEIESKHENRLSEEFREASK